MDLKVYIDTNIFLDSILNRDNGIARSIFYFLKIRNIEIILNDVSVINIHYFAEKKLKPNLNLLKEHIENILDEYIIVSVTENMLRGALNSTFTDFEDGVQYFCAKKAGAGIIITNDKKGFINSDIETINSVDFYDKYIK